MIQRVMGTFLLVMHLCMGFAVCMDEAKTIEAPTSLLEVNNSKLAEALINITQTGDFEKRRRLVNTVIYPLLDLGSTIKGVLLADGRSMSKWMSDYINSDEADEGVLELYQEILRRRLQFSTSLSAEHTCSQGSSSQRATSRPERVRTKEFTQVQVMASLKAAMEVLDATEIVDEEAAVVEEVVQKAVEEVMGEAVEEVTGGVIKVEPLASLNTLLFELVDQRCSQKQMAAFCSKLGVANNHLAQALNKPKIFISIEQSVDIKRRYKHRGVHTPLSYAIVQIAREKDSTLRGRLASLILYMISCGAEIMETCTEAGNPIFDYMHNVVASDFVSNELKEFYVDIAYKLDVAKQVYLTGVMDGLIFNDEIVFSREKLRACWPCILPFVEGMFPDDNEPISLLALIVALISKKFKWHSITRLFSRLDIRLRLLRPLVTYCNTHPIEFKEGEVQHMSIFGYVLNLILQSCQKPNSHLDIKRYFKLLDAMLIDGIDPTAFAFYSRTWNPFLFMRPSPGSVNRLGDDKIFGSYSEVIADGFRCFYKKAQIIHRTGYFH